MIEVTKREVRETSQNRADGSYFGKEETLEFHEYLIAVSKEKEKYPSLRMGQVYYNVLFSIRPEIAKAARAFGLDPFYNDEIIPWFLAYVCVSW